MAATEKVPSALLLNPNPGISKRNCFVDLSALVGASPLTFHWTRNGADLVLSVLAVCCLFFLISLTNELVQKDTAVLRLQPGYPN